MSYRPRVCQVPPFKFNECGRLRMDYYTHSQMRIILYYVHYIMKLNQAFPIFQRVTLKTTGRPVYEANNVATDGTVLLALSPGSPPSIFFFFFMCACLTDRKGRAWAGFDHVRDTDDAFIVHSIDSRSPPLIC